MRIEHRLAMDDVSGHFVRAKSAAVAVEGIAGEKLVDFYEVRKNYVVSYCYQLLPQAAHTIHLYLKAEIPGSYQAPASMAYLYDMNEFKG